jgi:hypothetical protein
MTTALEQRAASRVAPIGLLFLVTASVGWGLNWPVVKFVFSEWPPRIREPAFGERPIGS